MKHIYFFILFFYFFLQHSISIFSNTAPVVSDIQLCSVQGASINNYNLLNHVSDAQGGAITLSLSGSILFGTAVINPNKTLTYTPYPEFVGEIETITLTACDNGNLCDEALISINLAQIDVAPQPTELWHFYEAKPNTSFFIADSILTTAFTRSFPVASGAWGEVSNNTILGELLFEDFVSTKYQPKNIPGSDTIKVLTCYPATQEALLTCDGWYTPNGCTWNYYVINLNNNNTLTQKILIKGNQTFSINKLGYPNTATPNIIKAPSSGTANLTSSFDQYTTLNYTPNANFQGVDTLTISCAHANSQGVCEAVKYIFEVSTYRAYIKAFLEGPCLSNKTMRTTLRQANLLPTQQPYNTSPWNYTGTENNNLIPNNAVDWVLIELKNTDFTSVLNGKKACWLLNNGTLQDVDGRAGVNFENVAPGNYHIIIRHRNHLAVMSATTISIPTISTYNFSYDNSMAYGNNQLKIKNGLYCLLGGDFYANGLISVSDFNKYNEQISGISVYKTQDVNLDKIISVSDFNYYLNNLSAIGIPQVRY